jgi:hypothetical protein
MLYSFLSQLEITEGKMESPDIDEAIQDEVAEAEVASDLEQAKTFAKTLNIEDVNSGEWFIVLYQKVVQSYDRNARAAYYDRARS